MRRIAILSPHLDDAVLSLGAAVARATRRTDDVQIVGVMANDPDSTASAGAWDRWSGFRTVGEAARARREEDQRACVLLGAKPVWLPYGDEQYDRGAGDGEIWTAILSVVSDVDTVLVPGFPLHHGDHSWLTELVLDRRPPEWRLGVYVEQPYALAAGRPGSLGELDGFVGDDLTWGPIRATWSERRAKRRALRQYRSQLVQMGRSYGITWRDLERRIFRFEARQGGESVAWLSTSSTCSV